MNINWKVRIKNKLFWLAFIPAVLLVAQSVAQLFGFTIDLGNLGNNLKVVVEAVFGCLALLGVVTDHTTEGLGDSRLALTYEEPKKKGE